MMYRLARVKPALPWLLLAFFVGSGIALSVERRALETKLTAQEEARQDLNASAGPVIVHRPIEVLPSSGKLSQLGDLTEDLHTTATRNGLTVVEASYKPGGGESNTQAKQIGISVHMRGSYPAMKQTIAALLADYPSLALDSVSVQRERATDSVTDINLALTYLYD